jgi:mannan endo-1,4-beta-mannosidase
MIADKIRFIPGCLILFVFLVSCTSDDPVSPDKPPVKTNDFLVDSLATLETIELHANLQKAAARGVMFGHQDDLAYGIGWWAEAGRSDVREVCGDYPAVYGWDLGDIQNAENLDGVNFAQMISWIKEAHSRGGINTISMHLDNPVTGGNAWDNSPVVTLILPGKSWNADYLKTLDRIAAFLNELKAANGTFIPVIFRPYHEHNHVWSWWGASSCTREEYITLWRMTVEYLRDQKGVHHLLYTISPQEFADADDYLERYPGDDYVDIFGFDYYKLWDARFVPELGQRLGQLSVLAGNHGKIAALTEVGLDNPYDTWWTNFLLAALKYNEDSKKVAWSHVWRNRDVDHHFAPYPGHRSAADFKVFYNDTLTLFESDLVNIFN